jgi:acetoin utilization protein AcuC
VSDTPYEPPPAAPLPTGAGPAPGPGCGALSTIVFDEALCGYDFGPGHPMHPVRVDLTMRLADSLGVLERVRVVPAPVADDDLIRTVHDDDLVRAVTRLGHEGGSDLAHGLGSDDNPVFRRMHEATAHVVGASVEAFRRVWSGESLHSANVTGGLHHAMPGRASGFCVYNDVAIGIQHLLDSGATRVAYVDVDAHHGDGVEKVFWNDPRVLTISLHETGEMLFPGTGYPHETGGPEAEGSVVNVALPPGTSDAGWLRAFHAVVPPLLREWGPEVLVTQHGCDSHVEDPLTHLNLTVDGHRTTYEALHALAHEVAGGRWIVTGGGGYALVDVVPRSWAHLLATMTGTSIDPLLPTPQVWRDHVTRSLGRTAPMRMTDGREVVWRDWSEGYDPATWLDRSVHATRTEVFPLHGLDPTAW